MMLVAWLVLAAAQAAAGQGGTERFQVLAAAGLQCGALQNYEFWAPVDVIRGENHKAADAAECCAACHAHKATVARGGTEQGKAGQACNMWAFCGDARACGNRFGECWLRFDKALPPAPGLPAAARQVAGWTSGLVYDGDGHLAALANSNTLLMTTPQGVLQVQLLPELAPTSVREIKRAVAMLGPGGRCTNCRIYRAERNFLLQGVLEAPGAYVATPRSPNPKQKSVMPRGYVCWAAGGGGPHFFINQIDQPGFGDSHLCWGRVTNMDLVSKILALPTRPKASPNEVTLLAQELPFTMTLK